MKTKNVLLSLLIAVLTVFSSYSQIKTTSAQDGDWANPLTWDCTCIPTPKDTVIINHDVTLSTMWLDSGAVTVNYGASLREATPGLLFSFVKGEFVNSGNVEFTLLLIGSGTIINNDSMMVDSCLWNSGNFTNNGYLGNLDSITNANIFINNQTGTLLADNFRNLDTVENFGIITADSMLNYEAYFLNDSVVNHTDFSNIDGIPDPAYSYTNQGIMNISNNFYNSGHIYNSDAAADSGIIFIGGNFYNGDTLGHDARFRLRDGFVQVDGDFLNTDTIFGDAGGQFCVADSSTNSSTGYMEGNFDFCDQTGLQDIDLNTGYVGGSITYCSTPCGTGTTETADNDDQFVKIYPNPFNHFATIEFDADFKNAFLKIYDITGKNIITRGIADSGSIMIDRRNLKQGMYFFTISSTEGKDALKGKFIVE